MPEDYFCADLLVVCEDRPTVQHALDRNK